MVLKLILTAALLVVAAEAHCHAYPCDKATERLQLCLKRGYQPKKLEGCKLESGTMAVSEIQKKICEKLEDNVKEKCKFECEKEAQWPGDGWEAVDIQPSRATEEPNSYGSKDLKFMIRSTPVDFDSSETMAEFEVKFLKPFTKSTNHFTPIVEFLDDGDTILATAVTRLQYFYINGKVSVQGWFSLSDSINNKYCRSSAEVKTFPTDEGPKITFNPKKATYVASFTGGSPSITVDLVKEAVCKDDVTNAFIAAVSSAKKVRFLLDAEPEMVNHLGDFVAVKYRFINRS